MLSYPCRFWLVIIQAGLGETRGNAMVLVEEADEQQNASLGETYSELVNRSDRGRYAGSGCGRKNNYTFYKLHIGDVLSMNPTLIPDVLSLPEIIYVVVLSCSLWLL